MGHDIEAKISDTETQKKIESLTKNLLECYEELDLIYRLSRRGLSTFDPQQKMEFILREAMEIFEADMGWVVCGEEEQCFFKPVVKEVEMEVVDILQDVLVLPLCRDRKSRVFYNLQKELNLDRAGVPDSFLCTLIKTDEAVYGALCVGRTAGKENFTAGDLKLSRVMASQAAIALENGILHQKRLEEEQAMIRLQEEFRLARSIQNNLLPKEIPSSPGYNIAGYTLPARSVGGDYYDFISMGAGHLALCLGDVSGKGMPAALLMAHLQAAVRGQTLMQATPAECLSRSNTLLFQSTASDRFATCFYGILDLEQHRLRYSNAGHDRPLVISGNGSAPRQLDSSGLVLGIMPDSEYSEASISLEPGDLLLIYSDGIIDAADGSEREFGLERLTELVHEHRGETAMDLVNRILLEVNGHAGEAPQTDDMTLVVIRRE
jgi:sigma-B regulation protein RsbU (phosphoserine phosphatase)